MIRTSTRFLLLSLLFVSLISTIVQAGPISRTSGKLPATYHLGRLHHSQLLGKLRSSKATKFNKKQRLDSIQEMIHLINAMKKSRFGG